jgi:hypothetical protein
MVELDGKTLQPSGDIVINDIARSLRLADTIN